MLTDGDFSTMEIIFIIVIITVMYIPQYIFAICSAICFIVIGIIMLRRFVKKLSFDKDLLLQLCAAAVLFTACFLIEHNHQLYEYS
jgi:uncharacterized membrane protein YwaF